MVEYTYAFYKKIAETARRSARHIVPTVLAYTEPKSVIDIGCGTGTWLSVFEENGIADFLGVDGDFVPKELLEIPTSRYVAFDLTRPFNCGRRFDLVISLEVAEHLPSHCAASFIASLVRLGPVVLFSAAIPGQGGTHHINEQWQDYWAELFAKQNFVPVDFLRRQVWNNDEVAWWYAQNTLLFCKRDYLRSNKALMREFKRSVGYPLSLVHPRKFAEVHWNYKLEKAVRELGRIISTAAPFILVDNGEAVDLFAERGQPIPFPGHEGQFNGRPTDDRAAIAEFERLRPDAEYLVIVHSAFWWLTSYAHWYDYVRSSCELLSESDCLHVYDLRKHSKVHLGMKGQA